MNKGSIKYLAAQIVAISVCGMIIFPLFDYLLDTFITNNKFTYSVNSHIVEPIFFGIFMGTVYWLVDCKKGKNK